MSEQEKDFFKKRKKNKQKVEGVTGVERYIIAPPPSHHLSLFLSYLWCCSVVKNGRDRWILLLFFPSSFFFSSSWLLFSSRVSIIQFICLEERLWMLEQVHGLDWPPQPPPPPPPPPKKETPTPRINTSHIQRRSFFNSECLRIKKKTKNKKKLRCSSRLLPCPAFRFFLSPP